MWHSVGPPVERWESCRAQSQPLTVCYHMTFVSNRGCLESRARSATSANYPIGGQRPTSLDGSSRSRRAAKAICSIVRPLQASVAMFCFSGRRNKRGCFVLLACRHGGMATPAPSSLLALCDCVRGHFASSALASESDRPLAPGQGGGTEHGDGFGHELGALGRC